MPTVELPTVLSQDPIAERIVLATVLHWPEDMATVEAILQPNDFLVEGNQAIYRVLVSLFQQRIRIEPETVFNELQRAGNAERYQITRMFLYDLISDNSVLSLQADYYAKRVREQSLRRQLRRQGEQLMREAMDEQQNVEDIITNAGQRLTTMTGGEAERTTVASIGEYTEQLYAEYYRAGTENHAPGMRTGWESVNGILRPFRPGQLIAISADTGIGKTIWTMSLAVDLAKQQHRGLIFSFEMRGQELGLRAALRAMNFTSDDLDNIHRHERANEVLVDLHNRIAPMKELPLRIDEDSGNTLPMIERAIQTEIRRFGKLDFVVVDYIGLIPTSNKNNRYQELGDISRALKELPKKYNFTMFVLCQLGTKRMAERPCRRPQLDDVYESGRIPQDCDLFLALYWPGHYGAIELRKAGYDPTRENSLHWNITELLVLKSRAGVRGRDWRTAQRIEPEHVRYHDLTSTEWNSIPLELRPH